MILALAFHVLSMISWKVVMRCDVGISRHEVRMERVSIALSSKEDYLIATPSMDLHPLIELVPRLHRHHG